MDKNNFDFIDAIKMINPFESVMNFFITGFIFAGLKIEIWILPALCTTVSALCFYLGLRMIRKENRAFSIAFYISIFFLIEAIIELVLLAIGFEMPTFMIYICASLMIVEVFFITNGFDALIKEKMYPFWIGFIYVFITIFGLLGEVMFVYSIMLYIPLFLIMIILLLRTKTYLIENNYQLTLTSVKIDSISFTLEYFGLCVASILISLYLLPLFLTQQVDASPIQYDKYKLLDTQEIDVETNNVFKKGHVRATIYDYNENYYLYVYNFQFGNPVKKITALNIQAGHYSMSKKLAYFNVYSIEVNNKYRVNRLPTGENDVLTEDDSIAKFQLSDNYQVRINPFDNELNIDVVLKVDKMKAYGEIDKGSIASTVDFKVSHYGAYPFVYQNYGQVQFSIFSDLDKWDEKSK